MLTSRRNGLKGESVVGGTTLFRLCTGFALLLHALRLFGREGLHGGADLLPHLRLIQLLGDGPALNTTYAPLYHFVGALLVPLVGLELYPKVFAFLCVATLLAGFRAFQTAARLPDECAALFALFPFLFTLSWCLPKVEAGGYGLALFGLASLLRGRWKWVLLILPLTVLTHTASALFLGFLHGVFALPISLYPSYRSFFL